MSESIKMSNEELEEIQLIRNKYQEKTYELGLLYIEKMGVEEAVRNITDRESKIVLEWKGLQETEKGIVDKLVKKYGEGTMDLSKGVFVPDKQ